MIKYHCPNWRLLISLNSVTKQHIHKRYSSLLWHSKEVVIVASHSSIISYCIKKQDSVPNLSILGVVCKKGLDAVIIKMTRTMAKQKCTVLSCLSLSLPNSILFSHTSLRKFETVIPNTRKSKVGMKKSTVGELKCNLHTLPKNMKLSIIETKIIYH